MDKKMPWFAERKLHEEKRTLAEVDAMIVGRQRGRVVEGKIVPFEQRMKELQIKKADHKGILSPSEEDELRRLELDLHGPLMGRRAEK